MAWTIRSKKIDHPFKRFQLSVWKKLAVWTAQVTIQEKDNKHEQTKKGFSALLTCLEQLNTERPRLCHAFSTFGNLFKNADREPCLENFTYSIVQK